LKPNRALKVGIAGCGSVAQSPWGHIPAFIKNKNTELVAVCDKDENLASNVAKTFGINRYYTDVSEMLKNNELDIVDICTPPKTHSVLSIMAMKSGCHVLVEKPMALSVKEADDMIAASKENGVKLCIVHNRLFHPTIMKTKSLVRKGIIGDVTGIDIRYGWESSRSDYMDKGHWYYGLHGGVFGEILPHPVYIARAFVGALEPVAVYSRKLSGYEWIAADELRVILEGEKGTATITISCNWPGTEALFDIFGTNRNIHIDIESEILTKRAVSTKGPPWNTIYNLRLGYQQLYCTALFTLKTLLRRRLSDHHILIDKAVTAIINDTEPPVTGEDGKEVIRVYENIISQIDRGQTQTD